MVASPSLSALEQAATAIRGIALAGEVLDPGGAETGRKIIRTHKDGRRETLIIDLNGCSSTVARDKDISLTANERDRRAGELRDPKLEARAWPVTTR